LRIGILDYGRDFDWLSAGGSRLNLGFFGIHILRLTVLRHAMRQKKPWEVFTENRTNREWSDMMHIPERENTL